MIDNTAISILNSSVSSKEEYALLKKMYGKNNLLLTSCLGYPIDMDNDPDSLLNESSYPILYTTLKNLPLNPNRVFLFDRS